MAEEQEISIRLVRSQDDEAAFGADYQDELRQFRDTVDASGIVINPRFAVFDSAGATGGFTGEFLIPMTQAIVPFLTAAVVVWVGRKSGRKLRLKVGDIELEGNTEEDIKLLVAKAKELGPVVDPDEQRGDTEKNN
ncbi:hypothetical protein JJQ97_22895 [Pseudomonas syringae]|uniref:hypothetical protein n=1 Tax=Pseudomonas syringae TaxID=317 RepID=UPI0019178C17|nr:hypothetical protein [Pseudomonas syringae]QQQ50139.1 hypothetical protein JJQ97_22895 [Pseudomonas syringae]